MNTIFIYIFISLLLSTMTYLYLHKKTRISLKFLYLDNLMVVLLSTTTCFLIVKIVPEQFNWIVYIMLPGFVLGYAFGLTMIRFWRTPNRKIIANKNELISPADGNILYIKKIEKGEVPVSIKKGLEAKLDEITQTDILEMPCWLIGINMTPFDVHKNCAPMDGKIVLNKHINGKFLSLKEPKAILENERNTLVIKNDKMTIGIVQTASKLVRRIDSYVTLNNDIAKGEWFGMIRFGSQVDLIIPEYCDIHVELGQQIYAQSTIIASHKD